MFSTWVDLYGNKAFWKLQEIISNLIFAEWIVIKINFPLLISRHCLFCMCAACVCLSSERLVSKASIVVVNVHFLALCSVVCWYFVP